MGLGLLPEVFFSGTLAEVVAPVRVVPASSPVAVAAPTVVLAQGATLPKKRLSLSGGLPDAPHRLCCFGQR